MADVVEVKVSLIHSEGSPRCQYAHCPLPALSKGEYRVFLVLFFLLDGGCPLTSSMYIRLCTHVISHIEESAAKHNATLNLSTVLQGSHYVQRNT